MTATMWDEPYLETCCRAALHRLVLAGGMGRPDGLKDGPCLQRLTGMGLAKRREDARFTITEAGMARHASEVMKRRA
jgi:DNA-binding transcriptional regulator PaaX